MYRTSFFFNAYKMCQNLHASADYENNSLPLKENALGNMKGDGQSHKEGHFFFLKLPISIISVNISHRAFILCEGPCQHALVLCTCNFNIVAGQEKPHMCILPLNMYLLKNIHEELSEISFIHVPGTQLY